jgi:serine O-acetyltransferase
MTDQQTKKKSRQSLLSDVSARLLSNGGQEMTASQLKPYPSRRRLLNLSQNISEALLPEYYCLDRDNREALQFHVGHLLAKAAAELKDQVVIALEQEEGPDAGVAEAAEAIANEVIMALPPIRGQLLQDAGFALERDPAARSMDEIILCYPGFRALMYHRLAHSMFIAGVPLIPRIISEHSHSETGIDIHPGARINSPVFIDHGTGIVIGETCRIGRRVTIYQGVTLGAKSFPRDADGAVVKGQDRHPIVEDDAVIYSGATILGRVTIGEGAVVGGNVWITRDVAPRSRVLQSPGRQQSFSGGGGI